MAFSFFILFIIAAVFFIILIFSSKRFSPIPYFPTQKVDLPLILKSLDLKNNQVIFDLGAGDGTVIFAAAKKAHQKKFSTKFIAVEINPILILILHIRRFFHLNKENIKIVRDDMFKINFEYLSFLRKRESILTWIPHQVRNDNETMKQFSNVTIYLYISPWFLDQIAKKILQKFPKAKIVSYMYAIKRLKNKERSIRGKNSIFIYG